HYYLKDHLGSVRVVFDRTGTVEQVNDYYPSGTLMYTSTNGTLQPYKFGGKELERTLPLDEYDFGARWMDPVVGGRFTTMDPLCEKYYSVSPYAYCNGDPVNAVDPDGRFPNVITAAISNIWQKFRHPDQYVSNIIDHGDRIEPERRYTYTTVDYHSEEGITVTSHSKFDWDGILADTKTSGDTMQDIGDVVTIVGFATACIFPPAGASIAKTGEAISRIGLAMSSIADVINLIKGSDNDIANDISSFIMEGIGKYLEYKINKLDIGDDRSKNTLKTFEKYGEVFMNAAFEKYIDDHKK
ncbi:MAG: RHS repeat-associated core domain-containing protein, partial [Prevotella sp.]|nr:RHS repeat-associated core domain-containing protein [Prevotella sp.]